MTRRACRCGCGKLVKGRAERAHLTQKWGRGVDIDPGVDAEVPVDPDVEVVDEDQKEEIPVDVVLGDPAHLPAGDPVPPAQANVDPKVEKQGLSSILTAMAYPLSAGVTVGAIFVLLLALTIHCNLTDVAAEAQVEAFACVAPELIELVLGGTFRRLRNFWAPDFTWIDYCPDKECVAFIDEHANAEHCPICGAARYDMFYRPKLVTHTKLNLVICLMIVDPIYFVVSSQSLPWVPFEESIAALLAHPDVVANLDDRNVPEASWVKEVHC